MTLRVMFVAIVCLIPAGLSAQPAGQSAATVAEAAGQWDEAIRLHRAALVADPGRSDLWTRIADIEARRGNLAACVEALEKAVAASPAEAPSTAHWH